LERELIACHAGHVAEERWHEEELGLGTLPAVPRHGSQGDAAAVKYLIRRFPGQVTPSLRRETALMAHALLDDHWPAVRRLVRALCARRLPVTLPGPVARRPIKSALRP
jgi:hypothetical protein